MDLQRFVAHQRRRVQREGADRDREVAEIRERLPSVVAALAALGARRVVLFGSIATGAFEAGSDVDLAVAGLRRGALIEAMAEAARILGRPVDVVQLEVAAPRLVERIEQDGEVLHDA